MEELLILEKENDELFSEEFGDEEDENSIFLSDKKDIEELFSNFESLEEDIKKWQNFEKKYKKKEREAPYKFSLLLDDEYIDINREVDSLKLILREKIAILIFNEYSKSLESIKESETKNFEVLKKEIEENKNELEQIKQKKLKNFKRKFSNSLKKKRKSISIDIKTEKTKKKIPTSLSFYQKRKYEKKKNRKVYIKTLKVCRKYLMEFGHKNQFKSGDNVACDSVVIMNRKIKNLEQIDAKKKERRFKQKVKRRLEKYQRIHDEQEMKIKKSFDLAIEKINSSVLEKIDTLAKENKRIQLETETRFNNLIQKIEDDFGCSLNHEFSTLSEEKKNSSKE